MLCCGLHWPLCPLGLGGGSSLGILPPAIFPPGGKGQGQDYSKVAGTWPGKARRQLLGLAWLPALGSGLFWALSSHNTSPSSLVHGAVAADSKYSLKETVTPEIQCHFFWEGFPDSQI